MTEIEDRLDRLESIVEQQQETIEAQRERIAELESDKEVATGGETSVSAVSRRGALTAGGLLALLFGGVGTASADPQGQVGTSDDPLNALYTEEVRDGSDAVHLRVNDGGPLGVDHDLRLNGGNSIRDASDNAHLTVNDGGNLGLNRTLDTNGNGITDSSGNVTLNSGLDLNGNDLTDGTGDVTLGTGLDADGVTASGTLDVQGGTVTNSTDSLTITTGDGNLTLNPDSNVYLSGNQLTGVSSLLPSGISLSIFGPVNIGDNYITEGTTTPDSGTIRLGTGSAITWWVDGSDGSISSDSNGRFVLDTPKPDGEVSISAPDTGDVSASDLDNGQIAFAVDSQDSELDVYLKLGGGTTGSATVASYSTERLKTELRPFAGDAEDVLDIRARTFRPGDGDGPRRLGITAESAHDAGLDHLVEYAPVADAWQAAEGIDEEYLAEYGVERDGETVVPNDIRDRAWLAMHHELLRDLVGAVDPDAAETEGDEVDPKMGADVPATGTGAGEDPAAEPGPQPADRPDRIDRLESIVERKDDRIDDLEAENDRLCERVAAIEDRLGVDVGGEQGTPADD